MCASLTSELSSNERNEYVSRIDEVELLYSIVEAFFNLV